MSTGAELSVEPALRAMTFLPALELVANGTRFPFLTMGTPTEMRLLASTELDLAGPASTVPAFAAWVTFVAVVEARREGAFAELRSGTVLSLYAEA